MFTQRQHSATTPYSIVAILACSSYLHATSSWMYLALSAAWQELLLHAVGKLEVSLQF
jgi:hypothetical protein